MASCAPVANRRRAGLLAETYKRVANRRRFDNLPHPASKRIEIELAG